MRVSTSKSNKQLPVGPVRYHKQKNRHAHKFVGWWELVDRLPDEFWFSAYVAGCSHAANLGHESRVVVGLSSEARTLVEEKVLPIATTSHVPEHA